MDRLMRALWGVLTVVVAALVAWIAAERWTQAETATARRALEARAAELTQRALAPGSPLACLDSVANAAVETACEKAVFANPETVAAAVAYVDAKLSLLADGIVHTGRDPGYADRLYRLRRGLEVDRFGVVAQALTARGCTWERCPALKLFHDPRRVAANLRERTFDATVALHSGTWGSGQVATASPPMTVPSTMAPSAPPLAGTPVPGKYDFPTAASIPPVSIMTAEPPLTKAEETAIAPPPPEPAATPTPLAAKKQLPARRAAQQPTSIVPLPQSTPNPR